MDTFWTYLVIKKQKQKTIANPLQRPTGVNCAPSLVWEGSFALGVLPDKDFVVTMVRPENRIKVFDLEPKSPLIYASKMQGVLPINSLTM